LYNGFILALIIIAPFYVYAGVPLDTVKSNANDVIEILRDPKLKGESGKKIKQQKIESAADKLFDFVELSKRTLGVNWNKFTPDQRKEFVGLFRNILRDAYIDKLTSYTDEKVSFIKEVSLSENTVEVQSIAEIKRGNIPINYRVINKGNEWKVYDVVVEGVSLVNNYRNQFREILGNNPPEKLLETLRAKVAKK